MPDFGDHVPIKATEETERLGLAGREGIVHGWTTPSLTRVEVVGQLTEDFAFNVNFEDVKKDDAEWVRLLNGEWEFSSPRFRGEVAAAG
ncbi:MAG: hypothetical protein ABI454_01710 [Sphingomicrobium sp.]